MSPQEKTMLKRTWLFHKIIMRAMRGYGRFRITQYGKMYFNQNFKTNPYWQDFVGFPVGISKILQVSREESQVGSGSINQIELEFQNFATEKQRAEQRVNKGKLDYYYYYNF